MYSYLFLQFLFVYVCVDVSIWYFAYIVLKFSPYYLFWIMCCLILNIGLLILQNNYSLLSPHFS